jgi:hypothetical protein
MVLHENGKYMTASEIVEAMNNHPANNGKRIFSEKTIKQLLWRLKGKNYKVVLAKKAKPKGRGRPENLYKIQGKKGRRYLETYLKNWDMGLRVTMKLYRNYYKKHNRDLRSGVIRMRLKDGVYDRFDFLFPDGLMNPKFHINSS